MDFEGGKPDEVKKLLKPCKDWALVAALRSNQGTKTSKMAYILSVWGQEIYIFFYFDFLCLIWHVIERYG